MPAQPNTSNMRSAVGDAAAGAPRSPTICTYQFQGPELWIKGGAYSFPMDVWVLGVRFVIADLGRLPFGKPSMRRHGLSTLLWEILAKRAQYDGNLQKLQDLVLSPAAYEQQLNQLTDVGPSFFEWGDTRGPAF